MVTIEIHDEDLAQRLRSLAEREQRPLEAVLKTLLDRYDPPRPNGEASVKTASADDARTRVRRKAFAKARLYWQSVGDSEKAALSDDELEEQFAWFDEEGIPRLKSELTTLEPPVGSLAYAAKIARERGGIRTEHPVDAERADDILNEEFADYLLRRMRGEDGSGIERNRSEIDRGTKDR